MKQNFIPNRGDLIWLDFEPTKGKEIGKYRPAYILSSKEYNKKTGLVICSPVSTSIRGHITEVSIEALEKPSVIATSLIQTLDWQERKAKLIKHLPRQTLHEVLSRVLPLIGAREFITADY